MTREPAVERAQRHASRQQIRTRALGSIYNPRFVRNFLVAIAKALRDNSRVWCRVVDEKMVMRLSVSLRSVVYGMYNEISSEKRRGRGRSLMLLRGCFSLATAVVPQKRKVSQGS